MRRRFKGSPISGLPGLNYQHLAALFSALVGVRLFLHQGAICPRISMTCTEVMMAAISVGLLPAPLRCGGEHLPDSRDKDDERRRLTAWHLDT